MWHILRYILRYCILHIFCPHIAGGAKPGGSFKTYLRLVCATRHQCLSIFPPDPSLRYTARSVATIPRFVLSLMKNHQSKRHEGVSVPHPYFLKIASQHIANHMILWDDAYRENLSYFKKTARNYNMVYHCFHKCDVSSKEPHLHMVNMEVSDTPRVRGHLDGPDLVFLMV